ncbi:MAG: SpoIIE family protein phosphatase [Deltaproteobacteria bacterium]|nr:SpoIIE family protein phosphatase [Deltaproteobacteria bacterium]
MEERRDLVRMLEIWGHALGASSVAIYAPAADGHELVATFGDGAVAERLAESESSADNLERVELPGRFVLLHDSDAPQEKAISAGAMLLACAAGIIRLEEKLDEQNLFAMAQGVELVALYEVGLAIASILELEPLVEELLSRALMLLEASRGALYQLQEGRYVLTLARGSALPALDAGHIEVKALLAGDGSAVAVLPGVRHVIGVAIGPTESRKGLLVVGSEEERAGGFSTKDRRTLTLFANQAAIALEKVRLHELAIEKERQDREFELAAEIQQQLLPNEMPQIPGFEVLGWSRPARVVGGDYFTFRDLGEGVWALIIGDVSGKGAPAALLVSTVDAALRVMLEQSRVDAELVGRLNQYVYDASTGNKYVTMVLASLDIKAGRLDFVNAGHNDGFLIRESGQVERLESGGSPVGLLPSAKYAQMSVELGPGDLVCLYSDGITECEDARGDEYGEERLVELLRDQRSKPLEEIEGTLNDAVLGFSAGQPQRDDQTVVLLRRNTNN